MVDLAPALLRHGYGALELERRRRGGSPCYETRFLGRRTTVLGGREGARLFYDEDVVRRRDAVPALLSHLLFGNGAVHGLDGDSHRDRKELFLAHLGRDDVRRCVALARADLGDLVDRARGTELTVFEALVGAYGRAVIAWAGIEVSFERATDLAHEYADIVAGFGMAPRPYAKAWQARRRTDAWAGRLIEDVRAGRVRAPEGTVLAAIANSTLDVRTAAVELGNILRPTVAVAWLGAFAVLALDVAQEWQPALRDEAATALRWSFAQEVRRTAPFVPALAGRVRLREYSRGDIWLRHGDRVVLDVRGINHDPALHPDPGTFRPDRFVGAPPGPFDLVPQGGGPLDGHRCPGESLALQLLAMTVQEFASVDFSVVTTRSADLTRIPTLPAGGVRVEVR